MNEEYTKLFSLSGKVALVTGASRGLGQAIALGLAKAGATVICCASKKGGTDTTEKERENAQYLVAKPIPLGGSSGRITTYAELVTSIINPSHKLTPRQPASFTSEDGVSLMRIVNDELTVSELIDLVAYLQPKYKVTPYRTSDYRLYQLRIPEKKAE